MTALQVPPTITLAGLSQRNGIRSSTPAISQDRLHGVGAVNAEIPEVVDSRLQGRIGARQRASFRGMKQLRCMEAEDFTFAKATEPLVVE